MHTCPLEHPGGYSFSPFWRPAMPATRRQFLNRFGVSLATSAGLFLLPGKLLAGGWGRRSRGCCPPPCYPPFPLATPSGLCLPKIIPPIPLDLTVAYPYPVPPDPTTPYLIPGGGGFYCWGTWGTGVSTVSVKATDSMGNPWPTQPTVQPVSVLDPCKWALAVGSFSSQGQDGNGFYLVYTYIKNGTNQSSPPLGPYST
jgi:hypothetical protein